MKKNIRVFFVFFIALIFMSQNYVHAYTNLDYYNNQIVNIGLESLKSTSITLTLNGDYTDTFNGVDYKSGTSLVLNTSTTKILFMDSTYDQLNFKPKDPSNTITINGGKYFGTMNFKTSYDSIAAVYKILPANTLFIEDYLKGVVGYEMSDYFPIEALKAQAIAARNYALRNINKHSKLGYGLCNDIDCQVYKGYNSTFKNVIKAVDETKGIILLYNNNLIEAYYSASDGGYTEDSGNVWVTSLPYLKAKEDSFDSELWSKEYPFTTGDIEKKLKEHANSKIRIGINESFVKIDLTNFENSKYTSGRASSIDLILKNENGVTYTKTLTKEQTRTFLSLPSAMYNITFNAPTGMYTFNGKGRGHGVGMSQIGAQNRAAAGQTAEEILKFYYDSTIVRSVYSYIKDINRNLPKLYTGDYASFNVEALGGTGTGYLYKYVLEKNSIVLYETDFIEAAHYEYKPKEPGDYNLKVYVKDKMSILSSEDIKTYSFNVEAAGEGDTNLDKIVDIFDLVMISKNMGKERSLSLEWNERWNLEDSNTIIDIMDIAKASYNYNKRY